MIDVDAYMGWLSIPEGETMNVDDVKEVPAYDQDRFLTDIFCKQFKLAVNYADIEKQNGFWHPAQELPQGVVIPRGGILPLDHPKFQHWTKEYFWRCTEELAEAIEQLPSGGFRKWKERWATDVDVRHCLEELADALHFLTEASVLHGIDPFKIQQYWAHFDRVPVNEDDVDHTTNIQAVYAWCMRVVRAMGLTANCLKNKPWKLTQMPTDRVRFEGNFYMAWYEMIALFRFFNCGREEVHGLYFKKAAVNDFRQATNY